MRKRQTGEKRGKDVAKKREERERRIEKECDKDATI